MSEFSDVNTQKLLADMKTVVTDAEEILQKTKDSAGDEIAEVRERLGESLRDARVRLAEAQAALVDHTKGVACTCDRCVREKPWQAAGIAACIGLLLGIAIGRR
ncbi:DUF883 family protein [Propionivibrio limicola]|uniref:DUF883 family protein n=1 Tax=Propionivibrio limicola TaxID=167645 RepID=UPI001290E94B|nr:DUF883 family protein [Propionivibrio limicola]